MAGHIVDLSGISVCRQIVIPTLTLCGACSNLIGVTYHLSLAWTSAGVGLFHLTLGLWCLLRPVQAGHFWQSTPRHPGIGTLLMAMAVVGALGLVQCSDLGEFSQHRGKMQIGCIVLGGGSMVLLRDFLTPRALGILLLLGAELLLSAAFPSDLQFRLVLVAVAYAWAVAGMAFVAAPYLYRDGIHLLFATPSRTRRAGASAMFLGLLLLALSACAYSTEKATGSVSAAPPLPSDARLVAQAG